jgi:phospholipase/lecithinase/hemolysin
MKRLTAGALALAAAALLAACGGGSGESADTSPRAQVTNVRVFGDSLADNGTFGIRATVQGAESQVFFERTAAAYGRTLCPVYLFSGGTFVPNPQAGCTNFAIGGGRINAVQAVNGLSAADPRGITLQMSQGAATAYAPGEMALLVGGGNDAADLVGAFLALGRGQPAGFVALMSSLLPTTQVNAALAAGQAGTVQIAGAYMQALADRWADRIQSNVLDRGAQRVVVLNIPPVTLTPRFIAVLDGVAAASGGGAAGAAARAQVEAAARGWTQAFNARLAQRFEGNARVAVVDFYAAFEAQVADPAQYGLTNVRTPACPAVGTEAGTGLPTYNFATCTATALSAAPPAGQTGPDWWRRYAFSDSFHPTPYGHQLVAQEIARVLALRGWL